MERQQVREWESRCIQEQPPACSATCPLHVDVRGLVQSVSKGDFAEAFRTFARSIPLPGIISHICDHPCEAECKRREAGEPVAIRALEQACCVHAHTSVIPTILQKKEKRVAVIGGGLSGVTAAVDLATKGYSTVIFEAKPRLLDRLFNLGECVLPASVIHADLRILDELEIEVHCDSVIEAREFQEVSREFDAVYIGIGCAATRFNADIALRSDGRVAIESRTFATNSSKVFAGGTHRYGSSFSPITSLQDGRYAAVSIARFLEGASLSAGRENEGPFASRLFVNTRGWEMLPRMIANDSTGAYTKDEAVGEAKRCFPCECLECVKVCEYLAHYKSYPKRYVREIYNNDCIVMGTHPANRMVNTCSLCGLCEAVCPEKLSMAEVCLQARQSMVEKNKMPTSIHDFALRDLAFSTSQSFQLVRHQPGFTTSNAVFFPGCQLSASAPEHVTRSYQHLTGKISGGVGLMLGCCGAPAFWSGEQALFLGILRQIHDNWECMGRPQVITACSTCYRLFKENLPEIMVESLWRVLDRVGLPAAGQEPDQRTFAIHDPCTTRNQPEIQTSVRSILSTLGIETVELNEAGLTTCCGYGGLMQFGDAAVAEKVLDRRIATSSEDYVTYCAMCRDNFARRGKRAIHVLDLLFGWTNSDPAARGDPGFSVRQENRARLKTRLLREFWREPVPEEQEKLELQISADVLSLMERRLILVEDIRSVIANAERTGRKILNEAGHSIASHRTASVTYWVEYIRRETGFLVLNAYSHRMEVG